MMINAFGTALILNVQSVHQIYCNNADTLMCSEKTLYNYIDARNIDLPRKVRYRPRRKKKEFKVDRGCYSGEYLGGIEYKRRKIAVTDGKNSAEILIDPVNQYDF